MIAVVIHGCRIRPRAAAPPRPWATAHSSAVTLSVLANDFLILATSTDEAFIMSLLLVAAFINQSTQDGSGIG